MAEKTDTSVPLRVSYEHGPSATQKTAPGSDLSLGGVFIETAAALPVGALLSLEIESGTTKVALDARILSLRAAEGPGRPAGLAVSFIDLPNEAAASLHFILATRMPRKGTILGLGEAEDDIPKYQSERKLPAAVVPLPKIEATPLARPPTPVMDTRAADAPPPQLARPAPLPISHPPAPAPLAPPSASASWAPPPAAAPVLPKRERRGVVILLAIVLLVAIAAAALLIGRSLM